MLGSSPRPLAQQKLLVTSPCDLPFHVNNTGDSYCPYVSQSVERLTAEQEVADSIPRAGPILRT